jgi:putative RNA 2'-phosphotransferase
MEEKRIIRVSKLLSLILRHKPEKYNLTLDSNGWLLVKDLIQAVSRDKNYEDFNLEVLKHVVEVNDKKRFEFNDNQTMIRASQGHSLDVDLELTELEPPEFLYHGTVSKNWTRIKNTGINKMSRTHVHLSNDKFTAKKVGSRRGTPVLLVVSSNQMFKDGVKFYQSTNGVWLTDFVDKKYIKFVEY